jgi:hypothetical protein
VSDPSAPRPPEDAGTPSQPTTREIPVVPPAATAPQLPPHPGASPPGPVPPAPPSAQAAVPVAAPVSGASPTGPVGFVPGLPGAGTPPPPAPFHPGGAAGATAVSGPVWPDTLEPDAQVAPHPRPVRDRSALLAAGLALVAVLLLEGGLSLRVGAERLWSATPLWSGFATLAAVAAVLALGGAAFSRVGAGVATRIAAAGLTGFAVFWLLVVLPRADTDRGFLLTAALGCLGAALWLRSRSRS